MNHPLPNPQNAFCSTETLLGSLYSELRKLADHLLYQERAGHTLQATALVHEAYLRLKKGNPVWQSEAHFFASAVRTIRRILIEEARRKNRVKRGGELNRTSIDDALVGEWAEGHAILELNDCLCVLEEVDGFAAQVAELRIFGGLTFSECAQTLDSSVATVHREWQFARAFLIAHYQNS